VRLYELLSKTIDPSDIFKFILDELLQKVKEPIRNELVCAASFFEHRSACGSKAILHLEAFVAKAMTIYKKNQIQTCK